MRLTILLLILAAFLQSSIIPLNLCLMILICRSLVVDEPQNYYMAFLGGIMLGILQSQNLGFWALTFLLVVKLTHLTKRMPFSSNLFTVLPVAGIFIWLSGLSQSLLLHQTINIWLILIQTLLCLPLYIIFRFWEERFVIRPHIKLKIKD